MGSRSCNKRQRGGGLGDSRCCQFPAATGAFSLDRWTTGRGTSCLCRQGWWLPPVDHLFTAPDSAASCSPEPVRSAWHPPQQLTVPCKKKGSLPGPTDFVTPFGPRLVPSPPHLTLSKQRNLLNLPLLSSNAQRLETRKKKLTKGKSQPQSRPLKLPECSCPGGGPTLGGSGRFNCVRLIRLSGLRDSHLAGPGNSLGQTADRRNSTES